MKLIIFDIDGTLCHSRYIDDKCYINAFKKTIGVDISNTDWNTYRHVTDIYVTKEIITKETGLEPNEETIELIINSYADELRKQIDYEESLFTAIPGAKELLDFLCDHKANYFTGIATGGFLKTATYKLQKIGVTLPVENVYSSNDFDSKQEMLMSFINRLSVLKAKIEKVVYVGDREYDHVAARELGIDFIGIDFKGNGKLKSLGIKNVINDYLPIEKFLALT